MASALEGITDCAVALHQHHGALEIILGLLALFHGAAPELALLLTATAERQHHGEGDLAFSEIVTDGFSEGCFTRRIIEGVINKLVGDAEIKAVILQPLFLTGWSPGDDAAQLAGGSKERRGLGGDHFEIGSLASFGIVRGKELHHFALG